METIGTKANGVYTGDYTYQGYIFKDMDCFNDENRRDEICYIAEAGFDDKQELTEEEAKAEIGNGGVDTHNSLFEYLKFLLVVQFGSERITDEFVENCCEYVFDTCDWQCLSTLAYEVDFTEDLEEYWKSKTK